MRQDLRSYVREFEAAYPEDMLRVSEPVALQYVREQLRGSSGFRRRSEVDGKPAVPGVRPPELGAQAYTGQAAHERHLEPFGGIQNERAPAGPRTPAEIRLGSGH